jgi:hypothetical protein
MAYDGTSKITGPVSIADIRRALGVTSNNAGELCTSPAIKKWARYKPVHCDSVRKFGALEESDFASQQCTYENRQVQCHYGLYIAGTNVLSSALHNVTYVYAGKPSVAAGSAFNIASFVLSLNGSPVANRGYNHQAQPTLSGTNNSLDKLTDSYPLRCRVKYQSNDDGVDILSIAAQPPVITDCYVCCMITGTNTRIRAMFKGDASSAVTPTIGKMAEGGFDFFTDLPSGLTAGTYTVTFFLLKMTASELNTYKEWHVLDGEVLMTSQPFPIPNITGLSITFRNLYTYIDFGMPTIKSTLDYMDVTGIPDEVVPAEEQSMYQLSADFGETGLANITPRFTTRGDNQTITGTWSLSSVLVEHGKTYTVRIKTFYNNQQVDTQSFSVTAP